MQSSVSSRAFNSISINYQQKRLIKTSTKKLKIRDEVNYYLNLPSRIAKFFPKLLTFEKDYSSYTIEYIPCKNLAELILSNQITIETGKKILKKLFAILKDMHHFKPNNLAIDTNNFYINKTIDRVHELRLNSAFRNLLDASYIQVNNKRYKSFKTLENQFIEALSNFVIPQSEIVAIHGDFCFSNILYCPETEMIKLIDPRGSFEIQGIYGHAYYDYAKLLHCLHGKYDYIVHNNYELKEDSAGDFIFKLATSPLLNSLHEFYRSWLAKQKVNVKILDLIEGSLFLSMVPLHYENTKRQKALYLSGIIILNNFFDETLKNLY